MKKAKEEHINGETLYNGLIKAYTSGNIGIYSNDISKISNGGKMDSERLLAIKILTAENNFVIDYAKTLYKPSRPPHIKKLIQKYTKAKLPHFFIYAKDKTKKQVEKNNNSPVNKLEKYIPNKRLTFPKDKFGKFDMKMLMTNPSIKPDEALVESYMRLNRHFKFKVNAESHKNNNLTLVHDEIKNELSQYGYSDIEIVDMLIQSLYYKNNKLSKEVLWSCYGDIILNNIKRNIGNKTAMCELCGKRFKKNIHTQKKCEECRNSLRQEFKTIICVDCRKEVIVNSKHNKSTRCESCYKEERKKKKNQSQQQRRMKMKSEQT